MQLLVVVLILPAKVALGLHVTAANFLNALREAHIRKEFGAEGLVVRLAILRRALRDLLPLLGPLHEHYFSEIVQQRANDELIVNCLVALPEVVQRELGCLKRVLHQVYMVAHVVRSTELFEELDDFLDCGLSALVQVCDVEEVAP